MSSAGCTGRSAGSRVLVVDDQPLNLELAAFVLAAEGFEVATAADSASACLQLQAFQPALVLLDIQLPGTDGLSLARRWKADPATRHIVLVAFTAYAMRGDAERMLAAGCDAYLPKPVDVHTLGAQVRALLGGQPAPAA